MDKKEKSEYEIQSEKIDMRMARIKRKIVIMSGKGGVGKTTVSVNLAFALSKMGAKVGILDADIHGPNCAKMLGCEDGQLQSLDGKTIIPVEAKNGIKVMSLVFALPNADDAIIWRGSMKMGVIRQFLGDTEWGDLDYLIIDTPPGTGDEQLTVVQSISSLTGAIIVTTPQKVAILDSRRSVTFARKCNIPIIGVIENMSGLKCPNCGFEIPIFGKDGGKNMAKEMGIPFLGAVPMEVDLMESEDKGEEWVGDSLHPSAKALMDIALNLDREDLSALKREKAKSSGCSPSMCASCHASCSSKNNNDK